MKLMIEGLSRVLVSFVVGFTVGFALTKLAMILTDMLVSM